MVPCFQIPLDGNMANPSGKILPSGNKLLTLVACLLITFHGIRSS
jgi:hypothetical protein